MRDKPVIEHLREIQLGCYFEVGQKYPIFDQSFVSFSCFSRAPIYVVEQGLEAFLELN